MIAGVVLTAGGAEACICFPPQFDPDDYDTVFLGLALDTSPYYLPSEDPHFITRFEVLASWRGSVADTLRVRANLSSDCGRRFEAGSEYLATAKIQDGEELPFTSGCDHSTSREKGTERIIRLSDPVFRAPQLTLPRLEAANQK